MEDLCKNLELLTLRASLDTITKVPSPSKMSQLKKLWLSGNSINSIEQFSIINFDNLEMLHLIHNSIVSIKIFAKTGKSIHEK